MMIFPSAVRCSVGEYKPLYSQRHHAPVDRLVARSVNQYCQITARTCIGGALENGLNRKSARMSVLLRRSCCSVRTTKGFSRQPPREANQRFHSKRGWYGA